MEEFIFTNNAGEQFKFFINECTNGMSKTNYTPEVIKGLISDKQQFDISEFCKTALEDFVENEMDVIDIRAYLEIEIID